MNTSLTCCIGRLSNLICLKVFRQYEITLDHVANDKLFKIVVSEVSMQSQQTGVNLGGSKLAKQPSKTTVIMQSIFSIK